MIEDPNVKRNPFPMIRLVISLFASLLVTIGTFFILQAVKDDPELLIQAIFVSFCAGAVVFFAFGLRYMANAMFSCKHCQCLMRYQDSPWGAQPRVHCSKCHSTILFPPA